MSDKQIIPVEDQTKIIVAVEQMIKDVSKDIGLSSGKVGAAVKRYINHVTDYRVSSVMHMYSDLDDGVECQKCYEKTFRIFKRNITIGADCCPSCVKIIDEQNEKAEQEASIETMSKERRRQIFIQKSHEWAESLHGKRVAVLWLMHSSYGSCEDIETEYLVKGIAYKTGNVGGGWGRVRVMLDDEEHKRISYIQPSIMWKGRNPRMAIIDGEEYGLQLVDRDGKCSTYVSWGNQDNIRMI